LILEVATTIGIGHTHLGEGRNSRRCQASVYYAGALLWPSMVGILRKC